LRVALITDGIWPYVLGGMQKHSFYLCKYLARNKVHVHLVHFNQSNYDINKLEFFSEEEKKFITPVVVDFPKSIALPGHYIRNSYKHSQLIFNAIKDQLPNFDFIYTKGFTGWYLIEQKKSGKIKCADIGVKFHGYEMFQRAPDFKTKLQHIFLFRKPVKFISQNADIVFSYGGKITDIIKSIGVPIKKIVELPSGVEASFLTEQIKQTTIPVKFIFLGRYERRKGVEELNKALKSISDLNFEFHFIGPIPEEKRLNLKNIIYHGEIRDKQQLTALIKNCDVLVCPSWSEGMPNVILEAMAQGLSVIATDVGATNVLINGKTGWLLHKSEPQEIKRMLEMVALLNPAAINEKKQNALDTIKNNFVWEKLISRLLQKIGSH